MRLVTALGIAMCSATLAGCASRQELAQRDDEYCHSIGLQFGTPQYAECRMTKDQQRADRRRAVAAALSATGAALIASGNRSYDPPQPAPPPVMCNRVAPGQMICQ